jgi:hypothetical protein
MNSEALVEEGDDGPVVVEVDGYSTRIGDHSRRRKGGGEVEAAHSGAEEGQMSVVSIHGEPQAQALSSLLAGCLRKGRIS